MHSEATTDLSILRANLTSGTAGRQNIVLIKTGALNPIHRSHISNLIKTKQHLEKVCGVNVIGGYLSPTHDEYVENKLGRDWISGEHRIAMCQKAIEEANQQHWIAVDKAECMASEFISLAKVALSLQSFINQKLHLPQPILVMYVAGLDLFNRCGGMKSLRTPGRGGVAVVYRSGENEHLVQRTHSEHDSRVCYVKDDDPANALSESASNQISSTQIRRLLKKGESCEHLTYPSVLQYLAMVPVQKN